jgi:hypothetical protein
MASATIAVHPEWTRKPTAACFMFFSISRFSVQCPG